MLMSRPHAASPTRRGFPGATPPLRSSCPKPCLSPAEKIGIGVAAGVGDTTLVLAFLAWWFPRRPGWMRRGLLNPCIEELLRKFASKVLPDLISYISIIVAKYSLK
jgi:hypothetical protein